jgi:hypothetical protein
MLASTINKTTDSGRKKENHGGAYSSLVAEIHFIF